MMEGKKKQNRNHANSNVISEQNQENLILIYFYLMDILGQIAKPKVLC